MLRIDIRESDVLPESEVPLQHVLKNHEHNRFVKLRVSQDAEVFKPDGSLLLRLIKDCLPEELCDHTYERLKTVKGDPANRPGILDKNARIHERRKDGTLSQRIGSRALINKLRHMGFQIGNTNMLGSMRSRNQKSRKFECKRTAWTLREPELYANVLGFVHKVDSIYKEHAPNEYQRQMEYVAQIPDQWKIRGTAFTTLYIIRNTPTATHTDDFDIREGFGVMATVGAFSGAELCFPKYRVAVNYQPGDVILADVHEVHGNFPQLDGDRVACVFFCRMNQHMCPA